MNISIARDFSKFPSGRTRHDGPLSGEMFREQHILPHLAGGEHITIDMDGTLGYAVSFLEGAFGGLDVYRNRITLVSDEDRSLPDLVWRCAAQYTPVSWETMPVYRRAG